MMKNRAKAVLAIFSAASALALSGPAMAQADTGFYAGASLGQSSADVDCTGAISCDDSDTAWKIFGGYRFNRNLAVEVGYTDLGKVTATDAISTTTFESTAFEVVGVGNLPVAEKFSVYGKVGFFRSDTDAKDPVFGSASDSATGLTFGVGVQYDFTKNLGVRGEWQRYSDVGGDNVGESDVDAISIGVVWRF